MLDTVKSERIIICLFTDADGRQTVGAANFDSERASVTVLSEAVDAISRSNGQVLDLDFPFN